LGEKSASSPDKASEVTFKEHSVGNNKNPNQKQPGEKEPGTFDYNPGNMSGKTVVSNKDESEQADGDGIHSRHDQKDEKKEKPPSR
jgi:hypothetical protein